MTREEFRRLLRTVADGWNVIIGVVVPGGVGKASGSNSMVQEPGELFGIATPVPEVTITKTLVASASADDLEKREAGPKGGERNARTKEWLVIGRIWHGWTRPENADGYERLLKEEIFPGIAEKDVPGYRGIQLLRGPLDDGEVEFVTIMRFDSWEAVERFSGEDHERAYVPQKAREVLSRFDERSQHYEIKEHLEY